MHAALADGQHVALVLDGPGTQQDFPVGTPGHFGERRRQDEEVDLAERTEEFGKARITSYNVCYTKLLRSAIAGATIDTSLGISGMLLWMAILTLVPGLLWALLLMSGRFVESVPDENL